MTQNKQQQHKQTKQGTKPVTPQNARSQVEKRHTLSLPSSLLIVFIIPVLLYLQTVTFSFTCLDDNFIISNNKAFLSNIKNVPQAFKTDAFLQNISPFYRPLQTVSYIVDQHISQGAVPWMFHLSNILLLGLIAVVLLLLMRRFLLPLQLALFATLLYCCHPLFVSSVAWIPARGDLLLTLFSLLSFLFLIDYVQQGKTLHLLFHLSAFVVALFSKETAAVLPVLFILYYLCFKHNKQFNKTHLLIIALYVVLGIVWFVVRSKALGTYTNRSGEFGLPAIVSNLPTFAEALSQCFIPFPIAPIPDFTVFKIASGIVILTAIVFVAIKHKQKSSREKLFFAAWFLLFMLPPLFYKHPDIDYFDHRFFLPLIGVLLLLANVIPQQWLNDGNIKKPWIPVAVLLILGSITFVNSRAYTNQFTFYNTAVLQNEHSALALYDRGLTKTNSNDKRGAIDDFTKALSLNNAYTDAYYSRGSARGFIGDNKGAIDDYNKALSLKPNYAEVYYNRGISKVALADYQGAIADYDKAISFRQNYPEAFNNRGIAKSDINEDKAAIADFDQAITLSPAFAEVYNNRGTAKLKLSDIAGTLADYNKALEINPNFVAVLYNRGIVYFNTRNYKQAQADFNAVISLRPDYAEAYNNLGMTYTSTGNYAEALAKFNKAIELKPTFVDAYYDRAFAKYSSKDYAGTIQDCDKVLQTNPQDPNPLNLKAKALQELHKTVK